MNNPPDARTPILLTFAPMVDSELSRLLLAHYRIAYRERDHLFGWVSLLTLFHGGYGRVPLLYGGGVRRSGPRAIAEHFDPLMPADRRLIPLEEPLKTEVEADWDLYNGQLALHTAVFAYFHLLPQRALMTPIFAAPVPRAQAKLLPNVYGAMAWMFRMALRLGPQRAEEALQRIRTVFDRTDARVADGRDYLVPGRVTLGDLALASAAAPLLLPSGYGAKMPPLEQMLPALAAVMAELRGRPTAAFVQRLYDRHARRPDESGAMLSHAPGG